MGQAAKGWASASMPTPVTSLGWPRAVEVYCRTSAQQAQSAFSVAIPDHASALEENWRALQSRHPEVLYGGDFLSHDWLADPFAKVLAELRTGPGARFASVGRHATTLRVAGVISLEVGMAGWRVQLPRVMMPPPERWPITTMGQCNPLAARESRRKAGRWQWSVA